MDDRRGAGSSPNDERGTKNKEPEQVRKPVLRALAVILPLAVGLIFFGGNAMPPSVSDRLKAGLQNPERAERFAHRQ